MPFRHGPVPVMYCGTSGARSTARMNKVQSGNKLVVKCEPYLT